MRFGCFAVAIVCLATWGAAHSGADWPQFRGPNRDGVSPSTGLLTVWPEGGPRLIWTAEGAGRGYSSCSIADGKLFTMGDAPSTADDQDEYLLCFDVRSGKQLWKHRLGPAWGGDSPDWHGSRSTPTIDGPRVYALTPHGVLYGCRADNGEELWTVDLTDGFGGGKGDGWGYGESVLVDGDRLLCTPGKAENTMVALDKLTGKKVWSASRPEDRGAGHASIQVSRVGDVKVYVNTTASGAMGVRASDGMLMWTYDIDQTTAVIPSPIIRDDLVFFTAGYGRGGALLRQVPQGDRVGVEEVYPLNAKLQNKHGGVVLVGNELYGDSGDRGMPFCADLMTGEIHWQERGSGKGSAALAAADGHLYIVYANAKVVLAKATSADYQELGTLALPDDDNTRPSWAHPVIDDGRLYIRHDDKIFCFDIASAEPAG